MRRMPRLLFLADRFPPDIGGLATSAHRLVRSLIQLGLEVDVLVWSRSLQPGELRSEAISLGSALHPEVAQFSQQLYRLGQYRHWDMTSIQTLNVLDWLHQTHQYDAIWGHYLSPAGFLAVWFAASKDLPSTVSVRGNDLDRELFPPGDFARLQWTLQRATVVTTVSQAMAEKIQRVVDRQDVAVIYNAVDPTVFVPSQSPEARMTLRRSLGIADQEIVLGFSGELREKKGQAFLLNALTAVRRQHPACLLIIGEVRQAAEAPIPIYAQQYPEDAARILVTGHLSEPAQVAQHLQACDVFLQPSLWEGLPNALLEAMACGLGCIASEAGGIPEVIEHGHSGFLLPCFQLHQLGNAVLEWLSLEDSVQRTIGQCARDRILQHFSLTQEHERLKALVHQLL